MKFYSFHGIYEEERIIGNNFTVSVDVEFETNKPINSIDETIDYTSVYDIIKNRMAIPTTLLELVAEDLIKTIHQKYPQTQKIKISIEKSNPPVNSFQGNVGISLQKTFLK